MGGSRALDSTYRFFSNVPFGRMSLRTSRSVTVSEAHKRVMLPKSLPAKGDCVGAEDPLLSLI